MPVHSPRLPAGNGRLVAAATGVAAGVVALGASELVAGLRRDFSSPVAQVGGRVVDAAPPWLKTFAIRRFGTNDKAVLVGTVLALLALLAAALGLVARRHPRLAAAGVLGIGLVGAAAALAGAGGPVAGVPSIVGGAAGAVVVDRLAGWSRGRGISPGAGAAGAGGPSRRAVLSATAAAVAVGATAAAGGRALRRRFDAAIDRARVRLPAARTPLAPLDRSDVEAPAEGVTPFVTPNRAFYRVDTALEVPQVALDTWRLRVRGLVDRDLSLTYQDVLDRDLVEADVTLTCVSNEVGGGLAGTARWLGVPLRDLLDEAGVQRRADQIVGRSVDGYTCGFPVASLDDDRTALVAIGMNDEPLPVVHGFPARLLVAGLYGYVSATKWLTEIELTRFDRFDQYWVPRGWSASAPIKTASRIDTPRALTHLPAGRHAVAGVAWAQTRGISAVEVRVDDGEWQPSELAAAPNEETWRQWWLAVELPPGRHTLTCRATDGAGRTQTERRAPPRPDGSSGWHSVVVLVD